MAASKVAADRRVKRVRRVRAVQRQPSYASATSNAKFSKDGVSYATLASLLQIVMPSPADGFG